MRRTPPVACLVLLLALAALLPAGASARASDRRTEEVPFSVACSVPIRTACPQTVTRAVTTAGTLVVALTRAPGSSICLLADLFVDGAGRGSSVIGFPALTLAPGAHEVTLRFTRTADSCGPTDAWIGKLRLTTSLARVGGLRLTLRERLAAAQAAIRPEAAAIASRKIELERLIMAARDRGDRALTRTRALEAQALELSKLHSRARQAVARLSSAAPRAQGGGDGFRQALAQVGRRVADLEAAIVVAAREGRSPAVARRDLARARADRDELERGLTASLSASARDLRRRWQAQVDLTHERLHGLLVAQAEADRERDLADEAARVLLDERERLDVAAVGLARRLAMLDLDVREVRASADGRLVFHAEGTREEYELVRELDGRLVATAGALAQIERIRAAHRDAFYAAQREVIAAEARLAGTISGTAWARAGVQAGFYAWDVGSGLARGGPIGALTVATQKLVEAGIARAAASGADDGGIEGEMRRAYRDALGESVSGDRLGAIVAGRVLKETVGKAGRDTLNQWLASRVFGPLRTPLPPAGAASFFRPLPTPQRIRDWLAAPKQLSTTARGVESLRRGFQLNRGIAGSMVTGFLKDVGKQMALAALDDHERQAWRSFFEKDVIARAVYPLHRVSSDLYWEIHDAHHALLHAKTQLLDRGVDPSSGYRVLTSVPFEPATEVVVEVRVAAGGPVEPLALVVGGRRVAASANRAVGGGRVFTYRFPAADLHTDADGLVLIEAP